MTDTATHRLQCEARYLLGLPLCDRRMRLGLVLDKRGAASQAELKAEMMRQYREAQG